MSSSTSPQSDLPLPLKKLVNWTVAELGEVLKSELGQKKFNQIESIRRRMKKIRGGSDKRVLETLKVLETEFRSYSSEDKFAIAHAFGLMLEIINTCESAYRSYRLRNKSGKEPEGGVMRVLFVLTAHPTEARSRQTLEIFQNILQLLIQSLETPEENLRKELRFWLGLAWKIPLARQKKPNVTDEAESIYSIVFTPTIIEEFLAISQRGQELFIRTWVGGDKDGHPGVDENAMLASLNGSRRHLIRFVLKELAQSKKAAELLKSSSKGEPVDELLEILSELKRTATLLRNLTEKDGLLLTCFSQQLNDALNQFEALVGVPCRFQSRIKRLLELFPGLVIPLEFREDSEIVHQALSQPKDYAIGRMLLQLKEICSNHNPKAYVRGLVISMTEEAEDVQAALRLIQRTLDNPRFPAIPLFENERALSRATDILNQLLKDGKLKRQIKHDWAGVFEVMVGYSDSAKENGSLMSRYLIENALVKMEKCLKKQDLTPVFFHGSGGSVARGGGSIEEQIAWWPQSAKKRFKATVQGEMIQRSFATPEILRSQVNKIFSQSPANPQRLSRDDRKVFLDFAQATQQAYRKKVSSDEFMSLVAASTPYNYLEHLKLGSRPSKRKKGFDLANLRAIPWILCWTQTRVLFPSWWGLGSYWMELNGTDRTKVKGLYKKSPVFRSYIKLMGFTLAKVELGVWLYYLERSDLPKKEVHDIYKEFSREYKSSLACVRALSGQSNLLWYRPWLRTSIAYRSPLIHPLNVLQKLALDEGDAHLLRETVTGVASGMMTTG